MQKLRRTNKRTHNATQRDATRHRHDTDMIPTRHDTTRHDMTRRNTQRNKQTSKQANKQTSKQANKQTSKQANKQTNKSNQSNQIKCQIKSNQINSNQLQSNQIKSTQIKSNQIKANQIKAKNNQLPSTKNKNVSCGQVTKCSIACAHAVAASPTGAMMGWAPIPPALPLRVSTCEPRQLRVVGPEPIEMELLFQGAIRMFPKIVG